MDLHIHSIYSGGNLTPSEIVCEAAGKKIEVISITDFDEISGYYSAKAVAGFLGVKIIPGIELKTNGSEGEFHILGYQMNLNSDVLTDYIGWRKKEKIEWAARVLKKLQELGFSIEFSSCMNRLTGTFITEKHIAKELCRNNFFRSSYEAYVNLLIKGAPAYVARPLFTVEDAVQLIHQAGGEAYLAHPGKYEFEVPISRLVAAGLDGFQVYHPSHSIDQVNDWVNKALHSGLKITGGSGYIKPGISPSIGSVMVGNECRKQWRELEFIQ